MTHHCPFCGNYAYVVSVGDAYQMDCRYCEIQVEITKRAYVARCPNPVATLDYIREKMKGSTRPRVDLPDMKRTRPPLDPGTETATTEQSKAREADSDLLTTAAKVIGSTLGKIAVKTGIVKAPDGASMTQKRVAAKKKAPAVQGVVRTAQKTVSKKSPKKSTAVAKINAKIKKPAAKGPKQGKS